MDTPAMITIENGAIHIRFAAPPDSAVRAGIKACPPWAWKPDLPGQPWIVRLRYASKIVALLPGAEVSLEVLRLAGNGKEAAEPSPAVEAPACLTHEIADFLGFLAYAGHTTINHIKPEIMRLYGLDKAQAGELVNWWNSLQK